jgi:hypothetical protein
MARLLNGFCLFGLLLGLACPPGRADDRITVQRSFASYEDFDGCFRDTRIDVSSAKGFVRLVPEDYVIHTNGNYLAGMTAQAGFARKLRFAPDFMGKKVFELETVDAKRAEVFVFSGSGKASFNGYPIQFGDFVHHSGWMRAEVGPEMLLKGRNELIFHAGFGLAQDKEANPPKFSFVSKDDAKTWQPAEGGEFLVHLRLLRHPAEGTTTSPVIDLANPDEKSVLCPLIAVDSVSVECLPFTPAGTSVTLEARSGNTPLPDAGWSAWQAAKGVKPARYVQWRAILRTRNRERTPVLSEVTVRAEARLVADPTRQGLSVQGFQNQKIVRSSFPYGFQRPSDKLKTLRERYKLDEVIAAGKTEFDKLVLLRNWARRQWACNDGFGGTWDALAILGAPEGKKGMCVHFATVFTQCALALGFNARQIVIHHHFVADVWSNELQKWVLMDVEGVYPPTGFKQYGTAHYIDARTRQPLTCLEVHRAYHRALELRKETIDDILQVYSFDTEAGQFVPHDMKREPAVLSPFERFGYPPRNDYLDRLDPWEEYHGNDHYHSNSYLWWRSEWPRGADPQYSWKSDRSGDFNWTLNQAHLTLTATAGPGVLTVAVDSLTPNLKCLLYRLNRGEWRSEPGQGNDLDSRAATFRWSLEPGTNVLEVKPVNLFDRDGIASSAVVVRK